MFILRRFNFRMPKKIKNVLHDQSEDEDNQMKEEEEEKEGVSE